MRKLRRTPLWYRTIICLSCATFCAQALARSEYHLSDTSPGDICWPSIMPAHFKEIGLVVKESIFERAHVVIESSCQVLPSPFSTTDHDKTGYHAGAKWNQNLLIQMAPSKNGNLIVDAGIGYAIQRSSSLSLAGYGLEYHIEPSLVLPVTLSYNKPHAFGSSSSHLQFEWELNPYLFSRAITMMHRIASQTTPFSESYCTFFGTEKAYAFSPLDSDFISKQYQFGFVLERQSY